MRPWHYALAVGIGGLAAMLLWPRKVLSTDATELQPSTPGPWAGGYVFPVQSGPQASARKPSKPATSKPPKYTDSAIQWCSPSDYGQSGANACGE